MRILNYMNLYSHPVQLSYLKDRTDEFAEIYHAHQGMEWLYVHQGHGQVIVNQEIVALEPGCLFVFRPFQLHRIQIRLAPEERYIRSLFVFEPSVLDGYLAPFTALLAFFRRLWKEPLEQTFKFAGLPQQTIHILFGSWHNRVLQAGEDGLPLEEQMLFLMTLLHMLQTAGAPQRQDAQPVRSFSIAERVMQWAERHYADEFDLDRLAGRLHLTPTYVSGAFRQQTGTSITEYLTARRIREACLLLKTTGLSVQEVGQAVGLTNSSYFCNLFKKQVGLSPHRYRRAGRQAE
ncbi:AraC family transcriptional regulator [Paenibacillus protaetiae]|uniref:AraC family transcriptional regulator n=1 Tax=Paenibacillus protaetiae TaxID=2509456 RepID=A0A4P6EUF3_9BACL|nr:AraC family transcriptional regulator [Paenibacillus protaetiae]QAY65269.1 AraC family transcriptional regulator [Paenibacillus protaetiae]